MWALAQKNADVLRMSTLFTAQQVPQHLGDEEGIVRAIEWCKEHGITHVYIESFRGEAVPPREMLARAREEQVPILVSRERAFEVVAALVGAGVPGRPIS